MIAWVDEAVSSPKLVRRVEQTKRTGFGIAADRLVERDAVLAERQIERRRLEGPAPVVARRLALGRRAFEEVELAQKRAELTQRLGAGQVEARAEVAVRDVVEDLVDDVLAEPLLAAAAEGGRSSSHE